MDIKYITPSSIKKVLEDISNSLSDVLEYSDRDLTFDLMKSDKDLTDWRELKSTDAEDIESVYAQDLWLIGKMIAQLILFRRVVRQNDVDERDHGFPKGHVPVAFRFTESWNRSSGKRLKKWIKENYEEIHNLRASGWKDFFRSARIYSSLSASGKDKLKRMFS